ncbi:hypothetical protein [Phaeobacter sp. B1627]|uniref:hypothetical protein n=1 Tax=Phaeobacter sp. B1627 TaxID=2583809 RepID=UPI00111AD67D|nr:hypothetical protein [Phaeobacter sp. B1627]TNJ43280.1 hypothetical protein FGE21_09325 [Phaeobacter sp. B1627]
MFAESELEHLITAMRRTGVTELSVETAERSVRLALPVPAPLPASRPARDAAMSGPVSGPISEPVTDVVKSPGLGRFAPVGENDGLDAVSVGEPIRENQILGYVADGTVRLPVHAPCAGVLARALRDRSALVGYGDILFEIGKTS